MLAHLHDRRDNPAQAVVNLKSVLEHEPTNEPARRLLDKVEREWRAEAGFRREITPRFVVKYRDDPRRGRLAVSSSRSSRRRPRASVGCSRTPRNSGRRSCCTSIASSATSRASTHGRPGSSTGRSASRSAASSPPAHELERLVVHEYAHAAIHDLARGRAPRWLHEGLAQVLEGATSDPILRAPAGLTLAGVEALAGDSDPAPRARRLRHRALDRPRSPRPRRDRPACASSWPGSARGETMAEAMPRVYGLRARPSSSPSGGGSSAADAPCSTRS